MKVFVSLRLKRFSLFDYSTFSVKTRCYFFVMEDIETGPIGGDNDDACNSLHQSPNQDKERGYDIRTTSVPHEDFRADTEDSANQEIPLYCPICFEAFSTENLLIRSENCGHYCCQNCLLEYCEYHISSHRVPIPCPSSASEDCHHCLQATVVRHILSTAFLVKFDRLEQLFNNPSLVACPRCSQVVDLPIVNGKDVNARTCYACDHIFCSLHLDAHLGTDCQDHHIDHLSLPNTKPCSHCGALLYKYAGCDHVVCPSCQGDMCFRCGTHAHLTGKVTRYCSHCQQGYLDHRHLWQIRLYYCLTLPFVLPFFVAYAVVMCGGVVLTACCCGCFGCGAFLNQEKRKADPRRAFWFVTFIIFLPFLLLLYDVGYRFNVVDDFLAWSLVDRPASYLNESATTEDDFLDIPTTPTSSNSSEE